MEKKESKVRSDNPSRDWQEDFKHENGNYQNKCFKCGNLFIGHKRRVKCKICTHPPVEGQPVLDFRDVFHFVKSVQNYTTMDNEEAGVLYHILDMWEKKRYFEPATYNINEVTTKSL